MEMQRVKERKMMEFISPNIKIDFAGKFPVACIISAILFFGSLGLIFYKGLNFGVDFRGGAEVQVKFQNAVSLSELRKALEESGHQGASVQSIGKDEENEYLIKVSADEKNLNIVSNAISTSLSKKFAQSGIEIRKTDIVGPKAGAELRNSGIKAMIYAILAITIYIGLRFDFKYTPGAVVALIHDVTITIGMFALTGREFTLQIIAALLTIIGYSVNDTVVVFDRVRELEDAGSGQPFRTLINNAINETLSRTILTSGTVFIVSLAMFFWGGPAIQDFFFAMVIGVILGTYSTVYVATPLTLYFDKPKTKTAA